MGTDIYKDGIKVADGSIADDLNRRISYFNPHDMSFEQVVNENGLVITRLKQSNKNEPSTGD